MAAQPALLSFSDDRLEPDHLVRRLWSLAEEVLGDELRSRPSLSGGFSYDPLSLLCVWLYGFMQGERSSRRLEELCRYDARYEFLARSCRPDHTTLARFRSGLGETLDALLLRVCERAQAEGVLKRRTMAVDGTKVAARSGQWRRAREESEREDAPPEETAPLEEARKMVSHGIPLVGYNVQAAVDADSGLVTGCLVSEDANDAAQLGGVLAAAKAQSGALPERVVADRGYGTSANALAARESGVEAFLPSKDPGRVAPFERGEDGNFRCRAGRVPTQGSWVDERHGDRKYLLLRMSRCGACPLSGECPGKGRQRTMKLQAQDPEDEKHACVARCRTEEGRALLRTRSQTVERFFAELKGRFRFRRFSMFGKAKARVELGLGVLAHNLGRLLSLLAALFLALLATTRVQKSPRGRLGRPRTRLALA